MNPRPVTLMCGCITVYDSYNILLQGVLTLLDLRVEELAVLMKESKKAPTSPTPGSPPSAYSPMEHACCKDSLPKVYSKALDLQTMASEELCHIELVQDLILQFESETADCRQVLSNYERVVTELRNGMLEGKKTNQPWSSAKHVRILAACKRTHCCGTL